MEPLQQVQLPVPPMLEAALGYAGEARYVAFYWGAGDEVYWDTGWSSADGEWQGWLAFVRHPRVAPALVPYHFGDSDTPATHWLVLDRETRTCAIGTPQQAHAWLLWQNPTPSMPGVIDADSLEHLDFQTFLVSFQKVPVPITPEEIYQRLAAHARLVANMVAWIDAQGR